MFMMVMSSTIISWARPTTPRISQRRWSRRAAPALPAVSTVDMSPRSHLATTSADTPMTPRLTEAEMPSPFRGYDPGMTTSSANGGPGPVKVTLAPIPVRPLRRDAERNRQRILEAPAAVFTERGFAATLDDVARHAGVGVGTVYRRFPDKASLAGALFDERIDTLITLAEQARDEPDAWAALVAFLERSAEMLTGDRGL